MLTTETFLRNSIYKFGFLRFVSALLTSPVPPLTKSLRIMPNHFRTFRPSHRPQYFPHPSTLFTTPTTLPEIWNVEPILAPSFHFHHPLPNQLMPPSLTHPPRFLIDNPEQIRNQHINQTSYPQHHLTAHQPLPTQHSNPSQPKHPYPRILPVFSTHNEIHLPPPKRN